MGVCFSVNKFYLISFLFQKIEGDFNFASIQDDNFIFSRKTGFCKINYESQT
jgi:hypothetical protein